MSKREISSVAVAYLGIGLFFGSLLSLAHPLLPFCLGFIIALAGCWRLAEARSERFRSEGYRNPVA